MAALRFEWDERKATTNRRKHGVSFEEARTVFLDEDALQIADPDHSDDEDRFIMLGISSLMRVLLVCHCYRRDDEVIRIISARKADRRERKQYDQWRSR
ncbi:MAG TPA: BrnT family toxin [Polyangia bacterium]|nr:BrnT family toxin [Polyangia bacterium]